MIFLVISNYTLYCELMSIAHACIAKLDVTIYEVQYIGMCHLFSLIINAKMPQFLDISHPKLPLLSLIIIYVDEGINFGAI
jgi:hypothetical protein